MTRETNLTLSSRTPASSPDLVGHREPGGAWEQHTCCPALTCLRTYPGFLPASCRLGCARQSSSVFVGHILLLSNKHTTLFQFEMLWTGSLGLNRGLPSTHSRIQHDLFVAMLGGPGMQRRSRGQRGSTCKGSEVWIRIGQWGRTWSPLSGRIFTVKRNAQSPGLNACMKTLTSAPTTSARRS